jgi:hypothetical protein
MTRFHVTFQGCKSTQPHETSCAFRIVGCEDDNIDVTWTCRIAGTLQQAKPFQDRCDVLASKGGFTVQADAESTEPSNSWKQDVVNLALNAVAPIP